MASDFSLSWRRTTWTTLFISSCRRCQVGISRATIMGERRFLKNYRVYILTSVAYLGSLLFG